MDNRHAEEFKKLLEVTLAGHDGAKVALPRDVLAWWWKALKPYSFQNVSAAMTVHSRKSSYKPKPADLIEIINQQDGRPSADEAWPIALHARDESITTVWTEEIKQAWFHGQEVYRTGDGIGARMAFRQHYQKLIDQAREIGKPVKWKVSLGHDPSQRITVLQEAEQKGFLTHNHVAALLPSEEIKGDGQHIAALVGYDGKKDAPPTEDAKANLKKLRDALASPSKSKSETEAERKALEQNRRDELAEQTRLLEEAKSRYQEKTA